MQLTSSFKQIGWAQIDGDGSLYLHYQARYVDVSGNPTQKKIQVRVHAYGTSGGESASISGRTLYATVKGENKSLGSVSLYFPPSGDGGDSGVIEFTANYASNGTWSGNFTCSLSGGSGSWSGGGSVNGGSTGYSGDTSISLPNIDPLPSLTINSVSILSGGLSGNVVASVTKLRVNITYTYCRSITIKWVGAGIDSGNKSISTTYSSSARAVNYDMTVAVPASSSDYTLRFTVTYGNNTQSNQTKTKDQTVRGYWLPTYNTSTYTQRCDVNGNADAQGEYGRLYLTWKYASINGANSMQSITVKLNGTTLVNGQNCVITGSISAGYLNYIFPLQLSTQGDLSISMTDKITTATINSLAVPKSIMSLSLYQSNTDVGVTVGRMATSAGFYEALDFYLKGHNHGTFYNIYIDTSGVLHVGGYSVSYVGGNPV